MLALLPSRFLRMAYLSSNNNVNLSADPFAIFAFFLLLGAATLHPPTTLQSVGSECECAAYQISIGRRHRCFRRWFSGITGYLPTTALSRELRRRSGEVVFSLLFCSGKFAECCCTRLFLASRVAERHLGIPRSAAVKASRGLWPCVFCFLSFILFNIDNIKYLRVVFRFGDYLLLFIISSHSVCLCVFHFLMGFTLLI